MTRLTGSLLCAFLALSLLAGCNMPAPVPDVQTAESATLPPPSAVTPVAPLKSPTLAGTEAPAEAPAPAASETPAETPVPYDYSTLPGWFAYIDYECKGLCTNISIIHPDFLQRKVLTDHTSGQVMQLYWSPGGVQIAFTFLVTGEKEHVELRMVSTKAAKAVKLATLKAGAQIGGVDWAPNRKFLVYAAAQKDKNSQILRVAVADRKIINLSGKSQANDTDPDWSPDSKLIAFTSDRPVKSAPAGMHIWVMKTDGSAKKALLPVASEDHADWIALRPAWSPDSKKIAFYWLPPDALPDKGTAAAGGVMPAGLARGETAGGLWVMDANGKNAAQIAACPLPFPEAPVWSPDGKKIAFSCGDDTSASVVVANLEDNSATPTQGAPGVDYSLSWSPDGKAVLYLKKMADNQRTINLFLLDGETPVGESANTIFDRVVWSPVEKLP